MRSTYAPPEAAADADTRKGKPRGLRWPARLMTRLIRPWLRLSVILRIANVTVVNRPTKLIKGIGLFIGPKHLTDIDHFYIAGALRRVVVFASKSEVWDWPVAGWFMRLMGSIPVDRNDPAARVLVPVRLGEVAEHGGAALMYPEGTTVKGYPYKKGAPAVGKLKTGLARASFETNRPILLVGITGTDQVMPTRTRAWPNLRHPVIVHFDTKLLDPIAVRKAIAPDNPFSPTPEQERRIIERLTQLEYEGLVRLVATAHEAAAEQAAQKVRDMHYGRQLARRVRDTHRQLTYRR